MIDLLTARLPERQIDVVGDAAYATEAWRGVTGRVTVTSRLRCDAAIYDREPPRTGKQGRPRKWGQRLPSLATIALDPATHHGFFPIPTGTGGGPVLWEFESTR